VRACTGRYGDAWNGMQQMLRQLQELGQVRYQFIAFDFIGQLLLDLGENEAALDYMLRGQAPSRDRREPGAGALAAGSPRRRDGPGPRASSHAARSSR
jgi:hypothetical protein